MDKAMQSQAKSEDILDQVTDQKADIDDTLLPKFNELQELSDRGMAAVSNAGSTVNVTSMIEII